MLEPALEPLEGAGVAVLIYSPPLCPCRDIAGVARTEGSERSAVVLALGEISALSRRMSAPQAQEISVERFRGLQFRATVRDIEEDSSQREGDRPHTDHARSASWNASDNGGSCNS